MKDGVKIKSKSKIKNTATPTLYRFQRIREDHKLDIRIFIWTLDIPCWTFCGLF